MMERVNPVTLKKTNQANMMGKKISKQAYAHLMKQIEKG